jgi:glycerol-3-phosphate dehydrogenase (NAD(P)+)
MNISVFGAGAWGTALSMSLADRHQVMLFGRDAQAIADMSARRENKLATFPALRCRLRSR